MIGLTSDFYCFIKKNTPPRTIRSTYRSSEVGFDDSSIEGYETIPITRNAVRLVLEGKLTGIEKAVDMSLDNNLRSGTSGNDIDDSAFESFQQTHQATNRADNGMKELITGLLQQNAAILAMLQKKDETNEVKNFNIMPDLSKSIEPLMPDLSKSIEPFEAEKGPSHAREWLHRLETTGQLHSWPQEIKYETARANLKGAARYWYKGKAKDIHNWSEFKAAFSKTFIFDKSKTELWKTMQLRVQQKQESLSTYFHEKVSYCKELDLPFCETKEQVIIGLWSRDLSNYLMARSHIDEDDLYKDLISYDRVEGARRTMITNRLQGKVKKEEGTPSEADIKEKGRDQKFERNSKIKCFNCNLFGHKATECRKPRREKGSCYSCGSMEHKSYDCQKARPKADPTNRSENVTNLVEEELDPMTIWVPTIPSYQIDAYLKIKEEKISITPTLDTGSPISLISETFLPLDCINKNHISHSYQGINKSKLNIIGTFLTTITVCETDVDILFHVVPENTMNCKCLLGRNFIANEKFKITFGHTVSIENIDKNPAKPKLSFEMRIDVIDVKPGQPTFYFRPRRLSYYEKDQVVKIVDDLLAQNIIRKSTSEYSSPIVLVKKKTEGLRMCIDYRELNKITIRDNFPLPRIDDQIDQMRNKKYFTKLDLKNAFHHVDIAKDSIKFTSFVTHNGQYEYLKMPFGLKNSPATFMRYIDLIFRDLINQNKICIYIDDILIATFTIEENLEILNEIFTIMSENLLTLRLDKCSFLYQEINFLGYVINEAGIRPNKQNILAVSDFPVPKNFREVQSFLGLTSYFRRFINNFSLIAKPLYDLLRKNTIFKFGKEELEAFELLKQLLVDEPVLAIYNPSLETQLHCDASSHGYGSILLQRQRDGFFHPVFYFSKRTSVTESKYHSYELEMLAIIYSLQRFRIYLQGLEFKIITDCNSIKLALSKKEINPRILRWSLELQNYCYTIEHRGCKQMTHADALSRRDVLVIEENTFERVLGIKQDQDKDISQIRNQLENSESKFFELKDGLVFRKQNGKLLFYVPKSMEQNVIRTYHDELGHVGISKTTELVTRTYWFPNLKEKIKIYISNCLKCITYSPITGKREGFLHNLPKGSIPFNVVHIDHVGPFEKTRFRHKYILVIIDSFTKFVKLYACVKTDTKEVIKHLREYFSYYSKPGKIISDRGSCFTSTEFKAFLNNQGICHSMIATGMPQANGQVEVINKSISAMCSKLTTDISKWDDVLGQVEFGINNTVNRSTGECPSVLLFGVHQKGQLEDEVRTFLESRVITETGDLNLIRNKASKNIIKTQDYNKCYFDKKHKSARNYSVGDYVMITNMDVTAGTNKKLLPKFKGPYVITAALDNDRYIVRDPPGFQLTQMPYEGVIAAARMKPWHRDELVANQEDLEEDACEADEEKRTKTLNFDVLF
ncbi:Integrase zinc binding domain, partial [Popillia japonica]